MRAWLALTLPWKRRFRDWASVLVAAANALHDDPAGARLLCRDVASLARVPKTASRARVLGKAIAPWLDATDPDLAAAAVAALGQLRYTAALPHLHDLATDRTPTLVRQALVHALAHLEGRSATERIMSLGADPALTLDAAEALRTLRDLRVLPFLDEVARHHDLAHVRNRAKSVARFIRKHPARGKR